MILTDDAVQKILSPPTRVGEVYCKQVSLDQLGEKERELFVEIFPRFFEQPRQHPLRRQMESAGFRWEETYNERRFGSQGLPRGCYYTACSPETGFSQQTLAMELMAYAVASPEFLVDTFDLGDPAAGAISGTLDRNVASHCQEYQNRCIIAILHPLRGVHGAGRHETIVIPYQVTCLNRKAILDLRYKQAMEWLVRTLWEYFPGVLFMNLNLVQGKSGRTVDSVSPPMRFRADFRQVQQLLNDSGAATYEFKNCGLGQLLGDADPLLSVLMYILNPALGGTPIDTIIGEVLVASGVDCLIYPSARHDCGVHYKGDDPVGHLGWNVVDFSSIRLSSQRMGTYMVDGVEVYSGLRGHIEVSLSGTRRSPFDIYSWQLHGTAMETRCNMARNAWQKQLDLECLDFQLDPAVVCERTPWHSYTAGNMSRKPRKFDSWFDLRLAVITKEVSLGSFMLDKDLRRAPTRVGDFIVKLSKDHDLWASGVTATDFDEDDSFLVQRNVGLICPACGDLTKQLSLERLQRCLICGFRE